MKTPRLMTVLVATAILAIAGCGSDDDDDGGGSAEKATQAKASGDVTWCIGKDTTGAFGTVVDSFNKANPDANVKLLELPEDAGEQRRLQIQRLEAESPECDVLGTDVIWTAEYAAQGWLQDVSDFISQNGDKFIQSTVDTTEYEGKNYAVPFNSNAGFIYYRKDEVSKPPEDWQALYDEAKKGNGVVYQGFRYEGLTVNFLELLYSAGGSVISEDGKEATADSAEAKDVLTFMADGIKRGAEGEHDLQGGGVAAGIRVRQRDLHAQLAVRLRAGQGFEDRRQVRHLDLPGLQRQRGCRRARRLQPGDLLVLEE